LRDADSKRVENLRHVRNEVRGETNREVDWELGKDTTFDGGPDKEKSTSEQVMFHVKLPARDASGKAQKIVQTRNALIRFIRLQVWG
jgi:hypothetical protein